MTGGIDHLLVVVPAHDEAELLGRQLTAIASAVRYAAWLWSRTTVSTTVVLDSCTDASAGVAAEFPDVHAVEAELGSAGLARRLGVGEARARHLHGGGLDAATTWVACTDADSVVPHDWLSSQLDLAATGARLVLGTVWPDPAELEAARLRRWWARHHLRDGHPYVHGANLGFALDAYDLVGGFRGLPVGEDVDLVERMRAVGVTWTATSRIPVLTSSRLGGRAPAGFASYLMALLP
jgi:hypothetical protein